MDAPFRVLALPLTLTATIVLNGCSGLGQSPAASAPAYQTVTVKVGDVAATVSSSGTIALSQVANITPQAGSTQASAKLKSLDVKIGQQVKAGQQAAQLDTSDLQSAVQQAQANLSAAQATYNKTAQGATPAELAEAAAAVSAARQQLADAQAALPAAQKLSNDDTASGQLTAAAAQQALDSVTTVDKQTLAATQQALTDLQRQLQQDPMASSLQISSAKNSLYSAQLARDLACSQHGDHSVECKEGDASSNTAQTAIDSANTQAVQTLAQDQAKVNAVQQTVKAAQLALQKDVASAEASLKAAQQSLTTTQTKDAQTLQSTQAQLHSLASGINGAQAAYAVKAEPATQAALDALQAPIVSAQAVLGLAQQQLNAATLKAPFDGIVIATGASPGDSVTSTTVVVTVADLSKAEVDANVNQLDVGKLQVGQTANVAVDAFPDKKFSGKISKIASSATNSQGVITYAVTVALDDTQNVLRPGMTATVNIMVNSKTNVLEVPSAAIQQGSDGSFVQLPPDLRHQPVQTGLSSGTITEIGSGLSEGQAVAIPNAPGPAPTSASKAPAASSSGGTTPGLGNVPGVGGPPPPPK